MFPLAIIPNNDPKDAAAEVRRCAKLGLRGGDLAFKRMSLPLYHRDWDALWEAAAECDFPISFHSTGFKALRTPDNPQMEKDYMVQWRLVRSALFQLDTMEVLVSIIASGACEQYPELQVRARRVGRDLAAVRVRPARHRVLRPRPRPRLQAQAQRLLPPPGFVTYQQDQYLKPIVPLIGEDNIIWGADYPHPDCLWPNSHTILGKNLEGFSETVRRKITHDNVSRLYESREDRPMLAPRLEFPR